MLRFYKFFKSHGHLHQRQVSAYYNDIQSAAYMALSQQLNITFVCNHKYQDENDIAAAVNSSRTALPRTSTAPEGLRTVTRYGYTESKSSRVLVESKYVMDVKDVATTGCQLRLVHDFLGSKKMFWLNV